MIKSKIIWLLVSGDADQILLYSIYLVTKGDNISPGGSEGKSSAYNEGEPGSIPHLGRFPGEGNGNLLQHSCLENPMDGGAW